MSILERADLGTAHNLGNAKVYIISDDEVSIMLDIKDIEPFFLFYTRDYHESYIKSQLRSHQRYLGAMDIFSEKAYEETNQWKAYDIPQKNKEWYRARLRREMAKHLPDPRKEFREEIEESREAYLTFLALEAATEKALGIMEHGPQQIKEALKKVHQAHRGLAAITNECWKLSSANYRFLYPEEH